jgi:hypothetical protein
LSTPWCLRDLMEIVHPDVDGIVLPKVESAADLRIADWLIGNLERERGLPPGSIDLMPIIETALGFARLDQILDVRAWATEPGASRVKRVSFGAGDFTNDVGMTWSPAEEELGELRVRLHRRVTRGRARAADRHGLDSPARCRGDAALGRAQPAPWVSREGSASTRIRSLQPTKSSRPPMPRSGAPNASCKRFATPRRPACCHPGRRRVRRLSDRLPRPAHPRDARRDSCPRCSGLTRGRSAAPRRSGRLGLDRLRELGQSRVGRDDTTPEALERLQRDLLHAVGARLRTSRIQIRGVVGFEDPSLRSAAPAVFAGSRPGSTHLFSRSMTPHTPAVLRSREP